MKHPILESCLAKSVFYLFLVVCLLCFEVEQVDAHRVILFAWVEGDTVYVESKFHTITGCNFLKLSDFDKIFHFIKIAIIPYKYIDNYELMKIYILTNIFNSFWTYCIMQSLDNIMVHIQCFLFKKQI